MSQNIGIWAQTLLLEDFLPLVKVKFHAVHEHAVKVE